MLYRWAAGLALVAAHLAHDAQAFKMLLHKHQTSGRSKSSQSSRRRDVIPEPISIENVFDLYYSSTFTIGGQDLEVQLDTGSSELWVRPKQDFAPPVQSSNITLVVRYGIGNFEGALTSGEVIMGNVSIPKQSWLTYKQGQIDNVFQAGLDGMLGLGFSEVSTVLKNVRTQTKDDSGRTLLANYFLANPSEPRTFSMFINRRDDPNSKDDGVLMIGAPEPEYASVVTAPSQPLHIDASYQRWANYLDAVEVNGVNITLPPTVVTGAPAGKHVANIDSGTSLVWAPTAAVDAIYKDIPGARYFPDQDQYTVPCMSAPRVALWFGGQRFPISPMDLTRVLTDSNKEKYCTNAILHTAALSSQTHNLDWQIGDTGMRNWVTQFDYGTAGQPETANIRMVSTVSDELAAFNSFYQVRAKQLGVAAPPPITALPGAPGSTSTKAESSSGTETSFPTPSAPPGAPPTTDTDDSADGSNGQSSQPSDNAPAQNLDGAAISPRVSAGLVASLALTVALLC
ncbi:acid protease [Auriculariales sp. MPI-PUGE-AT-0066]|nr:acid protease [Auriculariales sp. MPI-PUGE-AT-0066]